MRMVPSENESDLLISAEESCAKNECKIELTQEVYTQEEKGSNFSSNQSNEQEDEYSPPKRTTPKRVAKAEAKNSQAEVKR